jgi:protein-disulfide isomerase
MKNIPLLVGTLVVTLLLVVGVAYFFSSPTASKTVDQKILVGNTKNVRGPENAKVTVVEFSDFQCPACGATQPLVKQLLDKHGNEIRFVYRHFPLTQLHPNAMLAALAAQAAASFNQFWAYHDLLFASQSEWSDLPADQAQQKFLDYAEKLQIDKTEFSKRIDSSEAHQQITDDISDGTKAGLEATPTFFVNGNETAAPQLLSTVESLLKS